MGRGPSKTEKKYNWTLPGKQSWPADQKGSPASVLSRVTEQQQSGFPNLLALGLWLIALQSCDMAVSADVYMG